MRFVTMKGRVWALSYTQIKLPRLKGVNLIVQRIYLSFSISSMDFFMAFNALSQDLIWRKAFTIRRMPNPKINNHMEIIITS